MIASEFPFQKAIGVEYASDLEEIATRNFEKFSSPEQRCKVLESYCHDAVTFPLPQSPLVLFFGHPFGDSTFEACLEAIRKSLREVPRKIYAIYFDPICGKRFLENGFREIDSELQRARSMGPGFVFTGLRWFETIGIRNPQGREFTIYESE